MATWQDIRALRAAPPGRAGQGGARQKTFSAALQQAQELAAAADHSGYASKPILLFYALSQASRALCAVRLDENWVRSGHGLSVPDRGDELLDVRIKAAPASHDLYHGVAQAVEETPVRGEASLGELWAALPDLKDIPLPEEHWPRPLIARTAVALEEAPDLSSQATSERLLLLIDGLGDLSSAEDLQAKLQSFPTLSNGSPASYPTGVATGIMMNEEERNGVVYRRVILPIEMFPVVQLDVSGSRIQDHVDVFRSAAPGGVEDQKDLRWINPGVGSPSQVLGPLSSWWTVLFILSSVARYQPALWGKALDVDRSPIAIGLERVLDRAQEVLPHYVLASLRPE